MGASDGRAKEAELGSVRVGVNFNLTLSTLDSVLCFTRGDFT